jgi:hypothetical protein
MKLIYGTEVYSKRISDVCIDMGDGDKKSKLSPRGWFIIYILAIILLILIIIYIAVYRPNHNQINEPVEGSYDLIIVDGFTDDINLPIYDIDMKNENKTEQLSISSLNNRVLRQLPEIGFA